jgi:hypothetical protein
VLVKVYLRREISGSVFIPGALPLAIDDALSGLNNVNKQVTNLSLTAIGTAYAERWAQPLKEFHFAN